MKRLSQGVTLIELAVVLAIVAILLSQAGPLFSAWMQNVQIRTATESIQNGLQLARGEAMRRNRSVMFWLTSTANPKTADWLVGCAFPFLQNGAATVPETPGDCPGVSTGAGVPANAAPYNWIQRQAAADQQTTLPQVTAVDANGAATSVVTFNSLGMVVTSNADATTPIAQINVAIPSMPASAGRPLQVRISAGQIRMCDPKLSLASDPRGCQ
jgi:type IV fimbrial biogenesis protein FimT